MQEIWERVKRKLSAARARLTHHDKALHDTHGVAHLLYFLAVFIEGHGVYATMGGVLLLIGVITWFTDGEV